MTRRFSIGLRSGNWDGHSINVAYHWEQLRFFLIDFAVCFRSSSFWKMLASNCCKAVLAWFIKILLYTFCSMIPLIDTEGTAPCDDKNPKLAYYLHCSWISSAHGLVKSAHHLCDEKISPFRLKNLKRGFVCLQNPLPIRQRPVQLLLDPFKPYINIIGP